MSLLDREKTRIILLTHYQDYVSEYPVNVHAAYCTESYLKGRGLLHKAGRYLMPGSAHSACHGYFTKILTRHRPALIYINSLTLSGDYDVFWSSGIPLIVHAHPLQAYLYAYDPAMLVSRLKQAALVLSSSRAQAKMLGWLVPGIRPEVVYPPILMRELLPAPGSRELFRAGLGIPEHAFVWVMASAYFNYSKDPLRFTETGRLILTHSDKPVYFLWIGGDRQATAVHMAMNLAQTYGIADRFRFTGMAKQEEYRASLGAADAFMLVSLEESFSIVTAEAIALGKPVLAFDCGGVREIIREENGLLVSAYSMEEYAARALQIMAHIDSYDPAVMRETVRDFDLEVQGFHWKKMLRIS